MARAFRDFATCLAELQAGTQAGTSTQQLQQQMQLRIKRLEQAQKAQRQTDAQERQAIQEATRKAFDAYLRGKRPAPTPAQAQQLAALDVKSQFARYIRTGRIAVDAKGRPAWLVAGRSDEASARAGVEYKRMGAFTIKSASTTLAAGQMVSFQGYLARFNNEDFSGDICLPGCFTATIADAKARQAQTGSKYLWPLLYGHDQDRPIGGILSAAEDRNGLMIDAEIDPDVANGRDAISQITKQYGAGLSIGYFAVKTRWNAQGARELVTVQIFEGSVVAIPANPLANVTSIGAMPGNMPSAALGSSSDYSSNYSSAYSSSSGLN